MSANEFSKLVFNISQQLSSHDVEALKYMYGVFHPENISNLGILRTLEKKGVFSSRNVQGLRSLLKDIHRCDLLDMLKGVVEDKRLQLCYYQAVSVEDQLEVIRAELVDFSSKQAECSPTERLFCNKITDRVKKVQKEMSEFLTQPLKAVCAESRGSDGPAPGQRFGCSSACNNGSKSVGSFSHSQGAPQTSTQIPRPQHFQRANQGPRAAHQIQSATKQSEREPGGDYDKLSPAGDNMLDDWVDLEEDLRRIKQQQQLDHKRGQNESIAIVDTRVKEAKSSATSLPTNVVTSTLVPVNGSPRRKVQRYRSNSVENLADPHLSSHIPIPRRLSDKAKCNSGDGNDILCSSGDSGFCDPSEFSLVPFKTDRASLAGSLDHIYMKPNKLTVNAPSAYSIPKRNKKSPRL